MLPFGARPSDLYAILRHSPLHSKPQPEIGVPFAFGDFHWGRCRRTDPRTTT